MSSLLNIYKNSYWYIYLVHGFCHLYWNGIEIFLRWNYWDHFLPHLWFFSRKMPFPSIGMVKLVSSNTDRGIRIRKFYIPILLLKNKHFRKYISELCRFWKLIYSKHHHISKCQSYFDKFWKGVKSGLSNSIFKWSLFHSNSNDNIHELSLYNSNYSYTCYTN